MAVRPAMQDFIDYVRSVANLPLDDSYNGITYWTDQQIQDVIDSVSEVIDIKFEALSTTSTLHKASISTKYWLDTDTVTTDITEYTLDNATLRLTSDETPTRFKAFTSHIYDVLSTIYFNMANQRRDMTNFRAGVNQVSASHTYEHCLQLSQYYSNKRIKGFRR